MKTDYGPAMALGPPASHDFADLSALANAASARPTWWRIARAAQAGKPAATRPLRSAVGELTRRKRTAQHTPEAPEEERGRVRRGTDVAVIGVRVQDHCAGRGWWLRCAQEPFAESGQPHLASVEQPFLAYRPPCPWPPEPFTSAASQWIAVDHLSTRSAFKT